jgi:hypothetical protein
MAPRGRRTAGDVRVLAEVTLAALGGGLLAAAVLVFIQGRLRTELVLFLIGVVTVLAVLAVGTLQSALLERAAAPGHPDEALTRSGRASRAATRSDPRSYPALQDPKPQYREADQVRSAQRPPAVPWYDATPGTVGQEPQAGRSALPAATAPVTPEPDLGPAAYDTYDVPGARPSGTQPVRRVVQCPRCGDFDIDLRAERASFAFACRACRHTWTWAVGRPWPTTVVRPTAVTDHTGRGAGSA